MNELSQKAIEEFESVLTNFKQRMTKEAERAISDLYCDLPKYIETDAWLNYRQHLQRELEVNVKDTIKDESIWARRVRHMIFVEHREELIKALDQDHLAKIAELEQTISGLEDERSHRVWGRY